MDSFQLTKVEIMALAYAITKAPVDSPEQFYEHFQEARYKINAKENSK